MTDEATFLDLEVEAHQERQTAPDTATLGDLRLEAGLSVIFAVWAVLLVVLAPIEVEHPYLLLFLTVAMAVTARISFPIEGTVAIPTQLLLVPMLMLGPPALAPVLVFAAIITSGFIAAVWQRRSARRLILAGGDSLYCLGPATVFAAAGSPGIHASALVIFGALASQIGLDANLPATFVSFRVHDGDDASCRSPGRPATPRLFGVDPSALADRGAFLFSEGGPWTALEKPLPDGAVPAIGDEGTVIWSLHLGLGETIEVTDAQGQPLKLRIVGITATSVLQGGLIIPEESFLAHFPGDGGYRLFLIDSATSEAPAVSKAMTEALRDEGLRVQPAWRRLASFQSVENTYLAIFQTLGALGLLFGCLGISILVLRHALERRKELSVLEAVGFTRNQVRWLFVIEHVMLVVLGLVNGAASAMVCLIPNLRVGAPVPVLDLVIDLLAILIVGIASAMAATWLALRGPIVYALQSND